MNYYEVLGVARTASHAEIRHAYLAKAQRLHPGRFPDAPDAVLDAVALAAVAIDQAWQVLDDPARRAGYDQTLDLCDAPSDPKTRDRKMHARKVLAEHVWTMERELGLAPSPVFGFDPPQPADRTPRPTPNRPGVPGGLTGAVSTPTLASGNSPIDPLYGLAQLADWLAPHPRQSRNVVVPDVCGMRASDAFYAVANADLHINFVRLTEHAVGDGTVVDQQPPAGSTVRRHSTLKVEVVYLDGRTRTESDGGRASPAENP